MYPVSHICALRGSSVLIPCTYDYPDIATVTERKWMKDIGSNWNAPPFIYQSNGESLDPDYTGRVQYTEQDKSCSFMLTGLRNNDSGSYYFQIKINMHPNAYTGVPGVCLSVAVTSTGSDEIFLGDNVTLTCSTESCSPNQTEFTWFKDGQPTYNTTSNTLSFNPVSYGDSANYSCASKDNKSVQSPQITLDVKYAPKDTSVSVSPSGEIVEGSSVTLTCSSNANPPVQNYTWFKTNGAAVWERKSQKDLIIAEISSGDSGQYYCEAQNEIGAQKSTAVSLVVADAPKDTSVSVSPSGEIVEGSSVTLTCSSNANPPVQNYTWFKTNGAAVWERKSQKDLIIAEISSGDSGQYYCEAQNEIGAQKSTAVSLVVADAPKDTSVSVSPSGEIVEGSSVTLTCSSNANPPVQNYTWFKTNGAAVWERKSQKDLIIAEISSGDSGQYYCEAQNEIGAQKSTAVSLVVADTPKNTSVSVSPSGEIVEGSSVTLICSSNANPPVQDYTWFKTNGAAVWERKSQKDLIIAEISSGDSGQYYCEAQNKHGAQKSTAVSLVVAGQSCTRPFRQQVMFDQ
ncbi:CD22 protein, partial [Amia calva]|nr:CD22 protein [Amia calva]